MKIFVAASYSSQVNYDTGEVYAEYRSWLEEILVALEQAGHTVACSLREDKYRINDADPAGAFKLDIDAITSCDVLLALLNDHVSAGVQTEVGYALALGKTVYLAHEPKHALPYINVAMVRAGLAREVMFPLDGQALAR